MSLSSRCRWIRCGGPCLLVAMLLLAGDGRVWVACGEWLSDEEFEGLGKLDYSRRGNLKDVTTEARAGLVLMGGGNDIDAGFHWMIDRSGGGDFLILRTSGTDAYNPWIHAMTTPSGRRCNSVATLIIRHREAACDPFVLEKIATAEALWIAGGDQAKHVRVWRGTPVEAAIEAAVNRGIPVGGTSSGLDVLGEIAYSAENDVEGMLDLSSDEVLSDPHHPRATLINDFLDIPLLEETLLESHLMQHDRIGRMAGFLSRVHQSGWSNQPRGIGLQSETALLVEPNGWATVIGGDSAMRPTAYFLKLGKAPKVCVPGEPLCGAVIQVQRVRPGELFNLRNWSGPTADSFQISVRHGSLRSSRPNLLRERK